MPRGFRGNVKREPLYTWAFKSSKPHGGTIVQYVTQLNPDHSLSCNCPGWIFCKTKKTDSRGNVTAVEKTCPHVRQAAIDVPDILAKLAAGETLELVDVTTKTRVHRAIGVPRDMSGQTANRVIDL